MAAVIPALRDIVRSTRRLLCFQLQSDEFSNLDARHLVAGLLFTWAAGVGRYWDSPRAHGLQYAGLGSVVYVVILAAVLWMIIKPLARSPAFGFRGLLIFLCLTSPPAWLYAIPVERFLPITEAARLNMWFLLAVAAWRVALLAFYLRRGAQCGAGACLVAVLLPITAIMVVLMMLNLEQAVFDIMGGLREVERTSADLSYALVFQLGVLSMPVFAITFLVWLVLILRKQEASPPPRSETS